MSAKDTCPPKIFIDLGYNGLLLLKVNVAVRPALASSKLMQVVFTVPVMNLGVVFPAAKLVDEIVMKKIAIIIF